MARIKDYDSSKNKSSGGYSRLFSDPDMALHHTAVHSTVIRNGNELPIKMSKHYNGNLPIFGGKEVNSLDKTKKVISKNPNGCIIIGGKIKIKNSNGKDKVCEVDLLIIQNQNIKIIELKDGNNLDTKKSMAEIDTILNCAETLRNEGYTTVSKLIAFNSDGDHDIKDDRIDEVFQTGFDFCTENNFDFDEINNERSMDIEENDITEKEYCLKIARRYYPDLFK